MCSYIHICSDVVLLITDVLTTLHYRIGAKLVAVQGHVLSLPVLHCLLNTHTEKSGRENKVKYIDRDNCNNLSLGIRQ